MKELIEKIENAIAEIKYLDSNFADVHLEKVECELILNTLQESEWISVDERLPEENKFRMSKDVLTKAGGKCSVKSYDYELRRWNGSPHITVTHWMPLPQ